MTMVVLMMIASYHQWLFPDPEHRSPSFKNFGVQYGICMV